VKLRTKLVIVLFLLILLPVFLASYKAQQELKKRQEAFDLAMTQARIEENQKAQDLLIPSSQELALTLARSLEQQFTAWGAEATALSRQIQLRRSLIEPQTDLLNKFITDHPGCLRVMVMDRIGVAFMDVPNDGHAVGK